MSAPLAKLVPEEPAPAPALGGDSRDPAANANQLLTGVKLAQQLQAPAGYRMLSEGEYIRYGDIYSRNGGASWHETRSRGKYSKHGYWPMARRQNDKHADASTANTEH
jgi:hypothetical protein